MDVFEAHRGNPALDHDNNIHMTYHEYQGTFDIALFLKKLSKVAHVYCSQINYLCCRV